MRIRAPNWTERIVVESGWVTRTHPSLRFMVGWPRAKVEAYCERLHFTLKSEGPMAMYHGPIREARGLVWWRDSERQFEWVGPRRWFIRRVGHGFRVLYRTPPAELYRDPWAMLRHMVSSSWRYMRQP